MYASDTNRAQRVSRLLLAAQSRGLERSELLRRSGLSEDQIDDPDRRVPIDKTIRLWRAIANRLDEPDLGLEIGITFQSQEAGVVGYAMQHSDTVRGALTRFVRFAKLLSQRATLALEEDGDRCRIQAIHQPLVPGFRQPIDEGIAGFLAVIREVSGRPVVPASVHLPYDRPADTSAHRRLLGSHLHFGGDRAAVVLWQRDVEAPTLGADGNLIRYLDELAEVHLAALPQVHSYSARVRQIIWPHLSEGPPPIQQIASELALSTRSLQRRLREEGTSFAEVMDGLRYEKAKLLLQDRKLAVYEVGYLLGYADPSTFHRAFRRWEGTSPTRFRDLTT